MPHTVEGLHLGRVGMTIWAGALWIAGVAVAPAAALAGPGSTHFAHSPDADAYILSLNHDTTSTNVSIDDYARVREKRTGDFLWVRRAGKSYLIEDRATLDAAGALFAPLRALEPEQEDLHHRQAALEEKERELDREEEDLDRPIDRLTESGESAESDEGESDEEMEAPPPATEGDPEELRARAEDLRSQQEALRGRQRELEAGNRELEGVERSLDAREDAIEKEAEAKLWVLIDGAVKKGVAKPISTP